MVFNQLEMKVVLMLLLLHQDHSNEYAHDIFHGEITELFLLISLLSNYPDFQNVTVICFTRHTCILEELYIHVWSLHVQVYHTYLPCQTNNVHQEVDCAIILNVIC